MENLEQRIARLEERQAWMERHISLQDRAMLDLNELCDRLKAELKAMQQRSTAPQGERENLERPPHY